MVIGRMQVIIRRAVIWTFLSGSENDGNSDGQQKNNIVERIEANPMCNITKVTAYGKRSSCIRYLLKLMRLAEVVIYIPPRKSMSDHLIQGAWPAPRGSSDNAWAGMLLDLAGLLRYQYGDSSF